MSVKRRNVSEIAEIHFQTATLRVRMSSSSFVKVFCNGSFTARPQVITSRNLAILSALSSLHSDQMSSREDHLIQLKTLFFSFKALFVIEHSYLRLEKVTSKTGTAVRRVDVILRQRRVDP